MSENEKTSKRVATIASKMLSMKKAPPINELWGNTKILAASALTQTRDKPKKVVDPLSAAVPEIFNWFKKK